MSSRIKITLPDDAAARLDEMAAAAGEPLARVAGQMVRGGLAGITAATRANVRDLSVTLAANTPASSSERLVNATLTPVRRSADAPSDVLLQRVSACRQRLHDREVVGGSVVGDGARFCS